jgi:membrane protein DedA with SNARE-associated domain
MDARPFLALFDPDTVQRWFEAGGYFVLFGLLFACGVGLPLPEDVPLLLGGYLHATQGWNIYAVGILAWCGIIGGDCCLYWLSRKYGLNITKVRLIGRHVTKERILWAEEKFEKYGVWVVAVCRLFAGVRGAMVIAAGAIKFNFLKFVIADGLAALVSGGLFVWLGWLAGRKFGTIGQMRSHIKEYEHWVVAGLALGVVLLFGWFWLRNRRHKPAISQVALEKVDHVADKAREKVAEKKAERAAAKEETAEGA